MYSAILCLLSSDYLMAAIYAGIWNLMACANGSEANSQSIWNEVSGALAHNRSRYGLNASVLEHLSIRHRCACTQRRNDHEDTANSMQPGGRLKVLGLPGQMKGKSFRQLVRSLSRTALSPVAKHEH